MKIFKSKKVRELTKIERRVSSLSNSELLGWTDQIMFTLGRNLSAWAKSGNEYTLEEARVGAEALHAILDTLSKRAAK
jgi:hypothetical protein